MTARPLPDGRWLLRWRGRRWLMPAAEARRWLRDGPPPEVRALEPPRRSRLRLTLAPARLVEGAGRILAPATAGPALALLGAGGALILAATAQRPPGPASWLAVLAGVLLLALVHELGHAAALCRGGGRPGAIGAAWLLAVPALWCDVSEAALLRPRDRVRVDLAGPAFQLGAAGAAALAGIACDLGAPLLAARAAATAAAVSLLPLRRADGGWALADALDQPRPGAPPPRGAGRARRRAVAAANLTGALATPLLLGAALWRLRNVEPWGTAAAVVAGTAAALVVARRAYSSKKSMRSTGMQTVVAMLARWLKIRL